MGADARFDVIVAGAGMAGATLALALARSGLRPALIDPQPFETQIAPAFDGRASAIAYAPFRAWDAIGAGDALRPHAQPIREILVTDGRAPGAASPADGPFFLRFDSRDLGERPGGEPLGYMVENLRTRIALADALRLTDTPVFAPAKIAEAVFEADGVRVTLDDGRRLTAPLAVAAEGRASPLRKAGGIGTVGWDYGQSGVVATVRLERPHEGIAYERFLPDGPFAILPLTGARASLVWTERRAAANAIAAAAPEVALSLLRRRFGEFLGEIAIEGPIHVYPLSLQVAERMTGPRLALLGDAAHGIHPIAGQGLNLGLKDAAALTEVLVGAARRGEDIGAGPVLERYARWRRFDTIAVVAAMEVFTRVFGGGFPPLRLARGLGLSAVNAAGPLKRFLMREAGGAAGDLPRLLRGELV